MKKVFEVGKKYVIRFYDHCIGDNEILCEIDIWVTKETATSVTGTWWRIINDDEAEKVNREPVTIIKSTIIKKRKLSRV